MANQRLTDKTALSENLASGDLLMAVDVSDTTGSSTGTSKKIENKYVIQADVVTGNLDLATSPLTLVASPGAGYFIQPITISIIFDYVAPASTTGGYAYIGYTSATSINYLLRLRDLFRSETADRSYVVGAGSVTPTDGTYAGNVEDKALYLYGMDLTGNSTFKVYTTYQIVKV